MKIIQKISIGLHLTDMFVILLFDEYLIRTQLRLSLSNNLDILREKLLKQISRKSMNEIQVRHIQCYTYKRMRLKTR